jgi:hypothetical protein
MREWLLVILPLAIVFYFLIFPDQLGPVIGLVEWIKD